MTTWAWAGRAIECASAVDVLLLADDQVCHPGLVLCLWTIDSNRKSITTSGARGWRTARSHRPGRRESAAAEGGLRGPERGTGHGREAGRRARSSGTAGARDLPRFTARGKGRAGARAGAVTSPRRSGLHVGLFGSRLTTPPSDASASKMVAPCGKLPRLDPGWTVGVVVCAGPEPGSRCVGSAARSHLSGPAVAPFSGAARRLRPSRARPWQSPSQSWFWSADLTPHLTPCAFPAVSAHRPQKRLPSPPALSHSYQFLSSSERITSSDTCVRCVPYTGVDAPLRLLEDQTLLRCGFSLSTFYLHLAHGQIHPSYR